MVLTDEQKAAIAAGQSVAGNAALLIGGPTGAAVQLASTLLSGVLLAASEGREYTRADFDAALGRDNLARADGLVAENEASGP